MSRRKQKIDMDGGAELGDNPFVGLSGEGLPSGPKQAPASERAKSVSKKPKKGRVELRRETSGRGGKTVTTLTAFPTHLPLGEMERLAFDLKKSCACGGALKGRAIELQGDVRDRAVAELEKRGFQPVRAGG